MSNLPPHLNRLENDLMRAARTMATPARPRRQRTIAGVAIAVTLTTGAALAANHTNPFGWFGGDSAREVLVDADTSRRVVGDFPEVLICSGDQDAASCHAQPGYRCVTTPNGGSECSGPHVATKPGEWKLQKLTVVSQSIAPPASAASIRRALASRGADEHPFTAGPSWVRRATVGDLLRAADAAPADFWDALTRLSRIQGGGASAGDPNNPGHELVPPPGVARFLTCLDAADLTCRPVKGSSLPVGAPIYTREPDATWLSVPRPTATTPTAYRDLVRQVLGHEPTRDEQLLMAVASLATTGGLARGAPEPTSSTP